MDPNATLEQLRAEIEALRAYRDEDALDCCGAEGSADRAVELFSFLDGWLSRGGFLPRDWDR